jgi:DNA-binding response OmpR family regulator
VIAIVSSSTRERTALAALCQNRGWVAVECDSIRATARLLQRSLPRTVLMRHSLSDGFSDQVLADLAAISCSPPTRSIVLLAAGTPSAIEARQINLGADCVLRDPIRTDTLMAYLAKYQHDSKQPQAKAKTSPAPTIPFAGGSFLRSERRLQHADRTAPLTPREIELIEHLVRARGKIVSYETLYSEILNRPFKGDTSNMRVLLGKLTASASLIGMSLRDWLEVIPKAGYRYREAKPRWAGDCHPG